MSDRTRIALPALGIALLVVVLVPSLFMGVCMATGMTGGMMGHAGSNLPWVRLDLSF